MELFSKSYIVISLLFVLLMNWSCEPSPTSLGFSQYRTSGGSGVSDTKGAIHIRLDKGSFYSSYDYVELHLDNNSVRYLGGDGQFTIYESVNPGSINLLVQRIAIRYSSYYYDSYGTSINISPLDIYSVYDQPYYNLGSYDIASTHFFKIDVVANMTTHVVLKF